MTPVKEKKRKSLRSNETQNRIFYAVMLIFPLAQFLVFYLGVNVNSILLSFKIYERGESYFAGFTNFVNVIKNLAVGSYIWSALRYSFVRYFFDLLTAVPLALLFSYYIYKKSFGSGIFKVILFLPSIISAIVMVTIFRYFSERAVPALFESLFHKKIPGLLENRATEFGTLLVYNLLISFGSSVLLYTGAMSSIDVSVVEAAKVDGIGYFKEFLYITLPQIFPTISTFLIVGVSAVFIAEMNIFAFYGPNSYNVMTIGYILFRDTMVGTRRQYPYLAAFGIILTALSVPLVFLVKKLLAKINERIGC